MAGEPATRDSRARSVWRALALVSGLLLAGASHPAYGLRVSPHAGCGDLCNSTFWADAGAEDVAAALAENPAALSYHRTMLWEAVWAQNAAAVVALLRAGAPPNMREETGWQEYILQEAAQRNGDLVAALLKGGAFADVADDLGTRPLHEAVTWGRISAVEALLEAGAHPRVPDGSGESPVAMARSPDDENGRIYEVMRGYKPLPPPPCLACRADILALLLAPPAPPRCGSLCKTEFWQTATVDRVRDALTAAPVGPRWAAHGGGPLHLALAAGADMEVLTLLLDHGVDPNGRDLNDDTPLHVAARTPGGAEATALLIARGARLTAQNARDWTPLHAASERLPTLDSMRVLLDAGADPDVRAGDTLGDTPGHLAVSQTEGAEAAALVLAHGRSDEPSRDRLDLQSLLGAAARSGHPRTVELLLGLGADAEGIAVFGLAPIQDAARGGNVGAIRVLLEHGADPDQSADERDRRFRRASGKRPLHWAVPHPAAVALLLEAGADPDGGMFEARETPLHRAAAICSPESVGLLLAGDADPDAQDADGRTPLYNAVQGLRGAQKREPFLQDKLDACWNRWKRRGLTLKECRTRAARQLEESRAAGGECAAIILSLIEFDADPEIGAHMGHDLNETPLDIARRNNFDKSMIEAMEDAAD